MFRHRLDVAPILAWLKETPAAKPLNSKPRLINNLLASGSGGGFVGFFDNNQLTIINNFQFDASPHSAIADELFGY